MGYRATILVRGATKLNLGTHAGPATGTFGRAPHRGQAHDAREGRAETGLRWALRGAPLWCQGHDPREGCAEIYHGGACGPCHWDRRKPPYKAKGTILVRGVPK